MACPSRPTVLLALILTSAAVRVDAAWLPNGTPVGHDGTSIAADGTGGVFVGSMGDRKVATLHRLTANGDEAPGWPVDARVYEGHGYPRDEEAVVLPDGTGGAYVVAQVNEDCLFSCAGDDRDIRIQRLLASGDFAAGWPDGGVKIGYPIDPSSRR